MFFNNELLNYLKLDENCDLEKGVLEELTIKGEVMVYKHWECIDNELDYNHLNELWASGKAFWKYGNRITIFLIYIIILIYI